MNTKEAARRLRISERAIQYRARNGRFSAKKIGRSHSWHIDVIMHMELTAMELAKKTNYSQRWIEKLCKRGAIKFRMDGNRYMIRASEADEFFERRISK